MHALRKRRLMVIASVGFVLLVAIALILFALRDNISLFYTPSQVKTGAAPLNKLIRVGGMVVKGSVKHHPKSLAVAFTLTDLKQTMRVYYRGLLPDLFREGQGIVAQGKINAKHQFVAIQVLAKHDEKYMPPEVSAALKEGRQ